MDNFHGSELPQEHPSSHLFVEALRIGGRDEVQELTQLKQDLIADCRRLAAIRHKVPFSCKTRLGLRLSQEQLDYLKEWVSGKIRTGNSATVPLRYVAGPSDTDMRSEWNDQQPRIIQIVEEIEQWTGIDLPRAHDGCPYFAHPDTMPDDWDWLNCFRLMCNRTQRMTNW